MTGKKKAPEKTWKQELWEWVKSLLIAFVLAMFIRHFFFQAFKIPSSSMEPTLQVGDHLIANKIGYRFREPRRGEVVIFRFPDHRVRREFVKRLVGLPGEKVLISGGRIYIDGEPVTEPRLTDRYYHKYNEAGEILVPEGQYFLLGDNSSNSYDSRHWGFVPESDLRGEALLIYWPPSRWQLIR